MSLQYGPLPPVGNLTGSGASNLLQTTAVEVRKLRINWQSYSHGQIISEEQGKFMSRLDEASSAEARDRLINEDANLTARVFLGVLNRISKEQTLQYILTRLDDMLQVRYLDIFPTKSTRRVSTEDKTRVELFHDYFAAAAAHNGSAAIQSLWSHLFAFFQRTGDPFCVYQASRIVAKMACWSTRLMDESNLTYYFNWLRDQLQQGENNAYDLTVARNLQMMLRVRDYRAQFVAIGGIETSLHGAHGRLILTRSCPAVKLTTPITPPDNSIVDVLNAKSSNRQLHYQLIFSLWCLAFNQREASRLAATTGLIATVALVARTDFECEKISRIALALFRTILEALTDPVEQRAFALNLVQCKVLRHLELLGQRDHSHDPELQEDIKVLSERLSSSVKDVSSLEEYCTELKSGRLDWSPVHQSESFWVENAARFTENNYEIVKMLVALIKAHTDPLSLSIAAHDIGEFVRHYPRGKRVLEKLGGKHTIMMLLQHSEQSVRYAALIALQKIMVHNWEYLGRQLDASQETSEGGAGGDKSVASKNNSDLRVK